MEQHQQAASTNWFNMSFLTLQFLCLLGKGEKAKVVPIAIVLSFWHYMSCHPEIWSYRDIGAIGAIDLSRQVLLSDYRIAIECVR